MKKHQFTWVIALMLATTASGARGDEKSAVAALEKMRDDEGRRLTITRDENRPGMPVIKVLIIGEVTNAALNELAALKELQSLTIHTCRNVDVALKGLGELTKLQSLDIQGCKMTHVGLKELERKQRLR